jgi:hypothetical protein
MDCKNCYKEKQNMIKRLHKYKSSKQALIDWNSQLENRLNIQKKNLIW